MKAFYNDKFAYDLAANLKLIAVIDTTNNEYVLKMMSHILNAQYFWNHRILNRNFIYGVWDLHNSKDLKNLANEFYQSTLYIIDNYDLEDMLSYKTTKGIEYTNSINDVLYHVLNHSNYHRGQVITALKLLDADLPDTNFISFKR